MRIEGRDTRHEMKAKPVTAGAFRVSHIFGISTLISRPSDPTSFAVSTLVSRPSEPTCYAQTH